MAIEDDVSVAANGDIRYTGVSDNYTVIELHRFLQDLADDEVGSGDDLLDITDTTPSDRSTDNIITLLSPYNIDDTLAEHLYDGSIIQTNGDTIYDGIVNFGNAGIYIDVIQNGALLTNFWTTALNADANQGITHRFMVKTRDAAADIDGRRLLGTTREFGSTYGEFPINGTARGNNVLALSNATDLNNQTVIGTVAGWTNITNTNEGYVGIDVTGDGGDEFYYSEWDIDTQSINDFYERMKWLTRRGTVSTLYGLSGDLFRGITHEIDIDTPTGTFNAFEAVSWTGGTGQMLAIDSPTAGTKMWIQLLTGVIPTDGQTITGGASSATVDVNVTVTSRPISTPFVGASTGSAIIGAYGIGIEALDLTNSDSLTDLTDTANQPPNNVTFNVNGLVIGEDRILVGPEDGAGGLDEDQDTVNGALSGGATSIVVTTAIPSDTPATGTVRVFNGSTFDRIAYSSYTGSTYTVDAGEHPGGIPNAISDGANIFISYVDLLATAVTESFITVYNADRTLFIRVRDGGGTPIKTFETTADLTSGGGSTTAIRTDDS